MAAVAAHMLPKLSELSQLEVLTILMGHPVQQFKLRETISYLRITSSKLHSCDSWVFLPLLLPSGEVAEARGGGEAKYGGDRATV